MSSYLDILTSFGKQQMLDWMNCLILSMYIQYIKIYYIYIYITYMYIFKTCFSPQLTRPVALWKWILYQLHANLFDSFIQAWCTFSFCSVRVFMQHSLTRLVRTIYWLSTSVNLQHVYSAQSQKVLAKQCCLNGKMQGKKIKFYIVLDPKHSLNQFSSKQARKLGSLFVLRLNHTDL